MTVYDEVEIEDMDWDEDLGTFFHNCPCGDRFAITMQQLLKGEDIAECPSCTLRIRVIFQKEDLEDFGPERFQEAVAC